MSNKHTPEPWARGAHSADNGEPFDVIFGADGGVVVGDNELTATNARRIVACVNACAGIPTEALALSYQFQVDAKMSEIEDHIKTVAQLDELRDLLKQAIGEKPQSQSFPARCDAALAEAKPNALRDHCYVAGGDKC